MLPAFQLKSSPALVLLVMVAVVFIGSRWLTQSAWAQNLSFTDIWGSLPAESGGHGVMWADVNADQRADLYLPLNLTLEGDKPDLFLSNQGGGSFSEAAGAHGVADPDGGSHGAAWADLDNDGDYDLANGTTYQFGGNPGERNDLYRNDGTGVFTNVTPGDMLNIREATRGLVTFDMDGDGDLDIYAVNGYLGTDDPAEERNEVYRNEGNFQFSLVTSGSLYTAPAGQGATDTDYDGDGDIDILAANRTGPVNILRNDGSGGFTLVSPFAIGLSGEATDGITSADVNNDGHLDLLLAAEDSGYLYMNQGSGSFAFQQSFSGTDGYMGGFADLDNDGDLDLVFAGAPQVYLNDGSGSFQPGAAVPVAGIGDPRGVAFTDLDNDGDQDFAVGAKDTRNYLIRNDFDSGSWLKVKLISPQGQAGAFGAKVFLSVPGQPGIWIAMREAKSNYGYLAQDDPVLHFGLGEHSAVDVTVVFLDGTIRHGYSLAANQIICVDGRLPDSVSTLPCKPGIPSARGLVFLPIISTRR